MNGDIGSSESIRVGENPGSSWSGYLKHSGTEGSEPEYGVLIESSLGEKTVNSTEYDTIAGSTVSKCVVDSGEGVNFEQGQALLVKNTAVGTYFSTRNLL